MINSNAVINNNYGRLQDLILVFKIPMVMGKNFFGIYVKLWHAPSLKFRQPCTVHFAIMWLANSNLIYSLCYKYWYLNPSKQAVFCYQYGFECTLGEDSVFPADLLLPKCDIVFFLCFFFFCGYFPSSNIPFAVLIICRSPAVNPHFSRSIQKEVNCSSEHISPNKLSANKTGRPVVHLQRLLALNPYCLWQEYKLLIPRHLLINKWLFKKFYVVNISKNMQTFNCFHKPCRRLTQSIYSNNCTIMK